MVQRHTPRQAAGLVAPGTTLTTSGFIGAGVPEALLAALQERFAETGSPRDLTLLFAAGQGDGKGRGLDRLAAPGLVARVIGGHWGLCPALGQGALSGAIVGYNWPQGVISHLFRDSAAGKPGTLTTVGLETFVDPLLGGGRITEAAPPLVERVSLRGQDMLFFPALPIHTAFLRGTTADPQGNISFEHEALLLDAQAQAMATRNSGGQVIVQVERLCETPLPPRAVVLPGVMVSAVVVARPDLHPQTFGTAYSPFLSGEARAPATAAPPFPLSARKIIARRAAMELRPGMVVNLGIGMPEGVAAVAAEEGLLDRLTLTAEPGIIGGQPLSGLDFGAALNPQAVISQTAMFDFYDGGGIDLACLGMGEVDSEGNINVSRFGGRLAGAGGFINISQRARRLVFVGSFLAGAARKFCAQVAQVTFSGARARRLGQDVLIVTERAVFRLGPEGVTLTEIAPGLSLERDILAEMDFRPRLGPLREMDARLFREAPMGADAFAP